MTDKEKQRKKRGIEIGCQKCVRGLLCLTNHRIPTPDKILEEVKNHHLTLHNGSVTNFDPECVKLAIQKTRAECEKDKCERCKNV